MIEAVRPHFAKPMLPAGAVGLRVLSLFDGMSCGQQALERIGEATNIVCKKGLSHIDSNRRTLLVKWV